MVVSESRSELTIAINDAESVPSTTALSGHTDLESQEHNNTPQPHKEAPAAPHDPAGLEDNSRVPYFSLPALFWFFFYNFGLFAWGGPVVQIALIKDHLVIKEQWITLPRFQRVFAVYQMVPGPSASALCMFFGCLSRGRIGGIVAGIGFILPGFLLMLLASYLYSLAGSENKYFNASLRALQPIVSAMILRATHKIADHSVINQSTHKVNPYLILAALFTGLNSALRINIFISLGLYGVIYALVARRLWAPAIVLFALQYGAYALYVVFRGVPSPLSLALGIAKTPSLINLLVLGLVAGSLSFGGTYTTIPFIQVEAVLKGAWLSQHVFIDCIAIVNALPAPLVLFTTFVGFQGGLVDGGLGNAFAGAVIITLGVFFPCFVFAIVGHSLLEKIVRNKLLSDFFEGLCASVIGVIAVTAAQILKSSIEGSSLKVKEDPINIALEKVSQGGVAAVVCAVTLAVLYKFTGRYTTLLLLASGAIAGQFLFL
ncbi:MAG: hypothetical protein M1813_003625 [Trichoglossum hirsutum]|nr:MAG: hypothetical protein M1813_003625 [Trichoglossum hirsutum]